MLGVLRRLGRRPTAVSLPRTSAVPGGVVILPIDAPVEARPVATLDGDRAMVLRDGERWSPLSASRSAQSPDPRNWS